MALLFFLVPLLFFFFFNDTATTEIYTLSLHDALPISRCARFERHDDGTGPFRRRLAATFQSHTDWSLRGSGVVRSEEHTSELQSRPHLVCRLLLEKKN